MVDFALSSVARSIGVSRYTSIVPLLCVNVVLGGVCKSEIAAGGAVQSLDVQSALIKNNPL